MSKITKIHSMINFSDLSKNDNIKWYSDESTKSTSTANSNEKIRKIEKNI